MDKFVFEGKKLAIVDDDIEILESHRAFLERRGFWVITFENPLEALTWFEENDVDIILLDFYMKELTGEGFVERYKGDAVILLHTGESGKIPEDEMMSMLNIHGYFDKKKPIEDLLSLIKSAIKTAAAFKTIKQQEKIIDSQKYEEEFIGRLLVNVTDEMKEQFAVMSAPKLLLQEKANELNSEELKEIADKWQRSVDKMNNMLGALNFRVDSRTTINDLFDTVKILTLATSSTELEETEEKIIPNCKPKYLVYILSEIIIYLYENKVIDTKIIAKKINDGVIVLINQPNNYDEQIMNRLNNIATFDENISINLTDNLLEIVIK